MNLLDLAGEPTVKHKADHAVGGRIYAIGTDPCASPRAVTHHILGSHAPDTRDRYPTDIEPRPYHPSGTVGGVADADTIHSTSGRVLTVACAATALIAVTGIVLDGGWRALLSFGGVPIWFAGLVWAIFDKPYVRVTDGGVEISNVLRRVQIPWPAVEDVDLRWGLRLITKVGNYSAWSVPPPPRPKFRVARNTPGQTTLDTGAASLGSDLGPGVRQPNRAARSVVDHWRSLHEAGYLDHPRLESGKPVKQWNWVPLIVLAVLTLLSVTGVLGYQLG